jgi:hypothetical protein
MLSEGRTDTLVYLYLNYLNVNMSGFLEDVRNDGQELT